MDLSIINDNSKIFDSFSFINPKIIIHVYINGGYNISKFTFERNPESLNILEFLSVLNSDLCFKEFHVFPKMFNSWNILDSEYFQLDKGYLEKYHEILTPHIMDVEQKEFNLIPAIIKYKGIGKNDVIKRYDFCFYIVFIESNFLSEDQIFREIFVRIKVELENKTIIRKLKLNNILYKNEIYKYEMYNSTGNEKHEFYEDILNPELKEISMLYSIGSDNFEYKIDKNQIEKNLKLWEMYNDLTLNNKYHRNYIT